MTPDERREPRREPFGPERIETLLVRAMFIARAIISSEAVAARVDIEQIVIDSVLETWNRFDLERGDKPEVLCARILRRKVFDALRRLSESQPELPAYVLDEGIDFDAIRSTTTRISKRLRRSELQASIREAVAALPPHERQIVVAIMSGESLESVAAARAQPSSQIRSEWAGLKVRMRNWSFAKDWAEL